MSWDPPEPSSVATGHRPGAAGEEEVKPGHRTSEFGLAVATIIAALVLALAGKIEGEAAMAAITATALGYGGVRAAIKRR